jgi:hypothetical protein
MTCQIEYVSSDATTECRAERPQSLDVPIAELGSAPTVVRTAAGTHFVNTAMTTM